MGVLHGPVVFIDDEVHDQVSDASRLALQIRDSGRPLAAYTELPPNEHREQWRSLGFVVLDWDLVPGSPEMSGSTTLSQFHRESMLSWLSDFTATIFCPVFIVSSQDTDAIRQQIQESAELLPVLETGRIAVFGKSSLLDDFIGYLERWVESSPALTALNIWANAVESATDRLFLDMDALSAEWPAYIWKNALTDSVDPSFELASVMTANLLHRIDPLSFDVPAISAHEGRLDMPTLRRVLQGRTYLPSDRLYPSMVLPGDLFSDDDSDVIWLNITPACHTVLNRPAAAGAEPDPDRVILHLVKGTKVQRPSSRRAFNDTIKPKQATPNGMLVHLLLGDDPVMFDFKSPRIAKWKKLKDRRLGRLLPPYITLAQQKHSAFLMNEGLPRVDWDLYDDSASA